MKTSVTVDSEHECSMAKDVVGWHCRPYPELVVLANQRENLTMIGMHVDLMKGSTEMTS